MESPTSAILYAIIIAWAILPLLFTQTYQPMCYIASVGLLVFFCLSLGGTTPNVFMVLFFFRYTRLIINLVAFCFYKPVAVPNCPKLRARDVTVIVPTVEPYGAQFDECIRSIHANGPAQIMVITAGLGLFDRAVQSTAMYPNIIVQDCMVQNKRRQICTVLPMVATEITVLCDDHVFWPRNFLPGILAPFDNPKIGCVGTSKRVRRNGSDFSSGFWNFLGCLYLERHNFEIAATNYIDGGVFVVSGRTSAHRSVILKSQSFLDGFTNEYTFFGHVGPLNADDDNFITRWMVEHGWAIKIQYSDDACIETTLGEYPKFLSRCLRWSRTTWRSNPRSLLRKKTWKSHPWCIYAVYITSLFNFALIYDTLLLHQLWTHHSPIIDHHQYRSRKMLALTLFIFASKLIKPWPHFRRHPRDLRFLPGYILFGYFHSLIKFYALLTFWNVKWGSRLLDERDGTPVDGAVGRRDGDPALRSNGEEGMDLLEGVSEGGGERKVR